MPEDNIPPGINPEAWGRLRPEQKANARRLLRGSSRAPPAPEVVPGRERTTVDEPRTPSRHDEPKVAAPRSWGSKAMDWLNQASANLNDDQAGRPRGSTKRGKRAGSVGEWLGNASANINAMGAGIPGGMGMTLPDMGMALPDMGMGTLGGGIPDVLTMDPFGVGRRSTRKSTGKKKQRRGGGRDIHITVHTTGGKRRKGR